MAYVEALFLGGADSRRSCREHVRVGFCERQLSLKDEELYSRQMLSYTVQQLLGALWFGFLITPEFTSGP